MLGGIWLRGIREGIFAGERTAFLRVACLNEEAIPFIWGSCFRVEEGTGVIPTKIVAWPEHARVFRNRSFLSVVEDVSSHVSVLTNIQINSTL